MYAKQGTWTRVLAIVGTIAVWLVLAAPIFFGLAALATDGAFTFDYFLVIEWFFVAIGGGLLLFWAAMRARAYRTPINLSLLLAIAALVVGQALADLVGLGGVEAQPAGWRLTLVVSMVAVYIVALFGLGISGIALSRHLVEADQEVVARL